jgi:IclR family pca regulon transcriptional regulator
VFGSDKSIVAGISLTVDANRMDIRAFEKSALPQVLRVAQLLSNAAQMSS